MNQTPRKKLKELILEYGPSLCDDHKRCEGLLRDFCGQYRREIFTLISALKEGVVADLLMKGSVVSPDLLYSKLTKRLIDNLGFSPEAAQWTVESWVLALGLVVENGLPEKTLKNHKLTYKEVVETCNLETVESSDLIVSALGDQEYKTIGAAILAATPGDRILVRPGVYSEQVLIDKPLEIFGDGPAKNIVLTNKNSPVVQMLTTQAKIKGITVKGLLNSNKKTSSSSTNISENKISFFGKIKNLFTSNSTIKWQPKHSKDLSVAIDIVSGELTIVASDIAAQAEVGIFVHGNKTRAFLNDCIIREASKGIIFSGKSGGTVEDCGFHANRDICIEIINGSNPEFRRCSIRSGIGKGVVVKDRGRGKFKTCKIHGNKLSGIEITQQGNPVFKNCVVTKNFEGVKVWEKGQGVFDGCEISFSVSANLEIFNIGNPKVSRTKIHSGKKQGVLAYSEAQGILKECEIFANAHTGMTLQSGANPTILKTKFYENGGGVLAFDRAHGKFKECDIFSSFDVGVEIRQQGDPVFEQCKMRDGKSGILVRDEGRGILKECKISGNVYAGIEVTTNGNPKILNCKILNGNNGVYIHEGGRGTIEGCEIFSNDNSGLAIKTNASPTILNCKIYGNKLNGVIVFERGKGIIRNSNIFGNFGLGVQVIEEANPSFYNCQIYGNEDVGVRISHAGRGLLEGCQVFKNVFSGVEVELQGNPILNNCKINLNRQYGVWVHSKGTGSFEECDLTGNLGGAWKISPKCRIQLVSKNITG